jgi:hypothetical protein
VRIFLFSLIVALFLTFGVRVRNALSTAPSALWNDFTCIHNYEGAWNANTGNGYYGGLQMDWNFMSAYGSEYLRAFGTADHWPPALQLATAIRAYLSGRGFWPWPYSARECGLLP